MDTVAPVCSDKYVHKGTRVRFLGVSSCDTLYGNHFKASRLLILYYRGLNLSFYIDLKCAINKVLRCARLV